MVHLIHLTALHEAGEVEAVRDALLRHETDHLIHHISAAGHHEAHISLLSQHSCCRLDEVLRSLLHRQTAKEGDHFILYAPLVRDIEDRLLERDHGIVYGCHLGGILMILLDHRPAGQFAHTHDMIGMVHTVLLYGIDGRINITAAAIEVGSVDMDNQWHTEDLLSMDTCRIGHPVVGMDQVVVVGSGDHAGDDGVVIDLVDQVVPILPGELDAPYIVRQHIPEVRIDMVPQVVVHIRTHHTTDPLLEIFS